MNEDPTLDKTATTTVLEILQADYLRESNILNLLPSAVYVCDRSGAIVNYNRKATELWGRVPKKGDKEERYCGSFRIYHLDGSLLPHDETPVVACLKYGLITEDKEVIFERPDLSRIIVRVNIVPIKDEQGNILGMINSFYDITREKQTQKELISKTRELQDYVDNAAVALHWVDGNGIIKWANQAELEMLGYTEEEYIGHHIATFHADKGKINDILQRLSCNETLNGYEALLRCKDGSTRTVQISSNVFWDEESFIHTRCFTIDVSEQKKLFRDLERSEARYRTLIETLQTPLYTTDAEGRITLYNKAAAELWGREPLIGRDLWCGSYKIFNTDGSHMPLDSCPMAVCLKEQRPVYGEEILVVRPDGTLRHVAPHPQPLFDESGRMTGAINMLVDITEIKETEQELRKSETRYRELAASLEQKVAEKTLDIQQKNEELKKSEERYHKMIDEVEDYAIILLDNEGRIRNWNRGAEKIKGYTEEQIVGKSFEIFYRNEDRDNGLPPRLIREAAEKGKTLHEGWRVRKDNSLFWASTVLTALHDEGGRVIGFSKVTRDLTERKAAEDQLTQSNSQLEFQNKELEHFAYAASHDMKEPIRKILFYTTSAIRNLGDGIDKRTKDYLDRCVSAATRMGKLIEDLLSYSKAASSADAFEELDLNLVTDEVLLLHKDELENAAVKVEYKNLPVLKGVPFQIHQLMDNLLSNSIKYRKPDGEALIRLEHRYVLGSETGEPSAHPIQRYHKLSISDNGIGFEQQFAEKIFEVFQRLTGAPEVRGSGIGLAICKKIVLNHNGFIRATGTENEGATFDVYLPVL
jgi:PAS domain S-box-containing protein